MLTLGALAPGQLRARLAGPGLLLRTGPFTVCVHSPIERVAAGLALLYADYPVPDAGNFTDFHLRLSHGAGLRRWLRPQVHFDHDGVAPFQPLPVAHAFPLFEWTMNWCVSARAHGWLIVHAAVVEKDGCAAILPAPPGSGKSTLCAALVSRGWRLLSDEMALLRLDDGRLTPNPRPVSLKNASIDIIQRYAPDAVMSQAVHGTVKGSVAHLKAPADSILRAQESAVPAWIVFPRYLAGSAPQLVDMAPARAFMQLAQNSFNYNLLGRPGFDALARLITGCAAYSFTYSALDDALAVFEALPRAAA